MQRLTTLVLNNNRISRVQGGVGKNTPMVETVVLTGNLLSSLDDLKPLARYPRPWFLVSSCMHVAFTCLVVGVKMAWEWGVGV